MKKEIIGQLDGSHFIATNEESWRSPTGEMTLNTWEVSVQTKLEFPLKTKIAFRHDVGKTDKYYRYQYVDFYTTKTYPHNDIMILAGLWHNSNHQTICIPTITMKKMIAIEEKMFDYDNINSVLRQQTSDNINSLW